MLDDCPNIVMYASNLWQWLSQVQQLYVDYVFEMEVKCYCLLKTIFSGFNEENNYAVFTVLVLASKISP